MPTPTTGFDVSQYSVDPSQYSAGSYGDFYRDWAQQHKGEYGAMAYGDNAWYEQWINSLHGSSRDAKDAYAQYQDYLNRLYEQDSLAKQRQFELYADSTRYQRLVDDLKKAGLNPWLALHGGSSSAGSVSVASHDASANKSQALKHDNQALSSVAKLITGFLATAFMVSKFL